MSARGAICAPPALVPIGFSDDSDPALALSCYLIAEDEQHGGHQGWPVYLLAGIVILCAGFWSALVAKLWQ